MPVLCDAGASFPEAPVLPLLKRHEIQVLLRAGHGPGEVATFSGISERSVRRVGHEEEVAHVDDAAERAKRRIGRPSKAEGFRDFVKEVLDAEPAVMSLEVLRRARLQGYAGGKSALYDLIAELRPKGTDVEMRFEGLPGEFSQHDFGHVDVLFMDGTKRRVHFFGSRLKYSRFAQVTIVPNEQVETLVRTLLDHFVAFGGVPLCAVFDRPRTVALSWTKDGKVTEWNPTFAYAAMEIGFAAEVCWPYSPRQKGAVEKLVGWVKGSFFKQRRFLDMEDLLRQLAEWLDEVNGKRPSRATDVIPDVRRKDEIPRLRAPHVSPGELALRIPIQVGPTAEVVLDTNRYAMPPEAAGIPGTLYLYRDRVRVVAGRFEEWHERLTGKKGISTKPELRAAHLASISGTRGKRYLKREQLFATGDAAVRFLTEVVHAHPTSWYGEVDRLHDLLQRVGPETLDRALRLALEAGVYTSDYVGRCLGRIPAARPAQPSLFGPGGTP
jgi:transposase